MKRRIRVLLADDDDGVRLLVRTLFNLDDRFDVVGECNDGKPAIELAKRLQPDVVIVDLGLPGLSGIRALPRLREAAPNARMIVLTNYTAMAGAAKAAGAHAVVAKIDPTRLSETLFGTILSDDSNEG